MIGGTDHPMKGLKMTTKPFRILVCGGRNWNNATLTSGVLDGFREQYHEKGKPIVIVEGGAQGADRLAREYAIKHDIPFEVYPALWSQFGRAAGPIRNLVMLNTGIDVVIAFPGGRGTQDTIGKANKMGIRVLQPGRPEQYDSATD